MVVETATQRKIAYVDELLSGSITIEEDVLRKIARSEVDYDHRNTVLVMALKIIHRNIIKTAPRKYCETINDDGKTTEAL